MCKQDFYRQEYRRLNPAWRDGLSLYRDLVASRITPETKVLDVGCGHSNFMQTVYGRTAHTYGVDPDKEALGKNTLISHKTVGSVEDLPFENNFFDLVVSAWVLEHLPDPEKAFQEIYRVLKPTGEVIFLTPNVWNYNIWIIRLIPEVFHDFLTKRLYGRQENDTYPKQYRVNSVRRIARVLETVGFKKSQLITNGDPSYISFNTVLFKFACLIEKILDFKPLRFMKVHLIGVYEK